MDLNRGHVRADRTGGVEVRKRVTYALIGLAMYTAAFTYAYWALFMAAGGWQ